jgi:putative membrane protein
MNDATTLPPAMGDQTESSKVRMIVLALSALVFLLVAVVVYMLPGTESTGGPSTLATLNAFLNSSATVCLVAGWIFIKNKSLRWHRRAMLAAFGISSMFLLTYLMHHAQVGSVPFHGTGALRIVYFSLLIPHILLSAAVVPMALLTIYRGWTARVETHRKIARITLPLWLFVSVSGVAVYFLLYHTGV